MQNYALKVASQILTDMPTSAFTQLWLQNITNTSDDWSGKTKPYDMPLCRLVARQPEPLWNNAWLKKKIAADLAAFPFFPCHGYGTIALTKSSPRESGLWFYGTMVNSASRRHGRLPRNFVLPRSPN